MVERLKQQFEKHGITFLGTDGRWTLGKMAVTGGFLEFDAILDAPTQDSELGINGGRILKLCWDWTSYSHSNGQRVLPAFDRGWDIPGHFIPLHQYGEALDCLNRLLAAVGDEPYKERYVDINALK